MSLGRLFTVATVCISLLGSAQPAQAWNGYPPFGAWAYGSAYSPWGVARSRTVYRTRYAYPYSWGGYGNLGFSATTRVRYRGLRWPAVRYYRYTPYTTFYSVYPRYVFPSCNYSYYAAPVTTYRVHYSYPGTTFYGVPAYGIPQYFVPTYGVPTCLNTTGYSTGISQTVGAAASANLSATSRATATRQVLRPATTGQSLLVQAANTNTSAGILERLSSPAVVRHEIPPALLTAADAIFQAGGYREAATAYAQLSVRFGSSETLMVRRFIAYVAAGDFDQAEAILGLSELAEFQLRTDDLPAKSLATLLKSQALIETFTEQLAKRALARSSDPLPMKSVATWLELAGDRPRAALFATRAGQLASQSATRVPLAGHDASPTNGTEQNAAELVSYP